jgi:hypothetical protein
MDLKINIAGSSFRDGAKEAISSLKHGQPLRLEREPKNAYDKNAVAIYLDGYVEGRRSKPRSIQLGYVPQKWSGTVSAAMDSNRYHVWASKVGMLWGEVLIKWVDMSLDPL